MTTLGAQFAILRKHGLTYKEETLEEYKHVLNRVQLCAQINDLIIQTLTDAIFPNPEMTQALAKINVDANTNYPELLCTLTKVKRIIATS